MAEALVQCKEDMHCTSFVVTRKLTSMPIAPTLPSRRNLDGVNKTIGTKFNEREVIVGTLNGKRS